MGPLPCGNVGKRKMLSHFTGYFGGYFFHSGSILMATSSPMTFQTDTEVSIEKDLNAQTSSRNDISELDPIDPRSYSLERAFRARHEDFINSIKDTTESTRELRE